MDKEDNELLIKQILSITEENNKNIKNIFRFFISLLDYFA